MKESEKIQQIIERLKQAHTSGLRPAFAYDRISGEVQADGVSLEYQEAGAKKYATDAQLFVVHNFQVIESASKEGRKVFNSMIDLALNFGIKNLIFKNTDRMSRNYHDLVRIDKLIDDEGFRVHFHQTGLVIHTDSSYNDRFLIGIQLAVAKHLSDKLRQDMREHNLYKARKGTAPGNSPYGYKYNRKEKQHEIDPEIEPTLRDIFDTYDTGCMSLDDLLLYMEGKGIKTKKGKPWLKGPLHKMLTNPFYHGEFIFRGNAWPGTHPPYYDKRKYNARLERLSDKYRAEKKREDELDFARLLRCSCGRMMTGIIKKKKYVYYTHKCTHTGKFEYIREQDALAAVDAEIERTRFSPEFAENLKELVRVVAEDKKGNKDAEQRQLDARIEAEEKKQIRLYNLYAEEGVNLAALKKQTDEIAARIEDLNELRRSGFHNLDEIMYEICEAIDFLRDTPKAALASPPLGKAAILKTMVDFVEFSGTSARHVWKKPYSFLMVPEILKVRKNAAAPKIRKSDGLSGVTTCPVVCPGEDNEVTKSIENLFTYWKLGSFKSAV